MGKNISTKCPSCEREYLVYVDEKEYATWKGGALIQDAMPDLSMNDRELLMTGTCNACWHEMWKEQFPQVDELELDKQ